MYSIEVIGCHRSSTILALKCQTCLCHFCHFSLTFGSTFVTWSSAPGVSMPESVFRKTVHGAQGWFSDRASASAPLARSLCEIAQLAGWAKPRSSQRPWIPSRKQRSAVWSVWRVPLLRWICEICEQLQTKMGSERERLNTVERNLWICGHCAEGSIRPKLRHKMNYLWLCQNSYWKWWFIVDLPIKNGDFP